jgi:DNA (cytosine-5)-methyltransferase 1
MKHLLNICNINGAEVEPVDIITFGSPCQDMSVAGKREGMKHAEQGDEETTRSGLFYEAIRIIEEMRKATNGEYPKYAVYENVPGAFSSNKGHDFHAVLEALCSVCDDTVSIPKPYDTKRTKLVWNKAGEIMGDNYSVAWRTLDAQYWGVPQRRKRIYLVADFTGRRAGEILFKPDSVRGDMQTGDEAGQEVTADAVGGVDGGVGVFNESGVGYWMPGCGCLRAEGENRPSRPSHCVIALQANGIDRADTAGCNGCGWRYNESYTLNTIDRHAVCYDARGNSDGETVLFEPRSPDGEPRVCGDICPTLNTAQGGQRQPCIATPSKPPRKYIIRRLTPTECARLQGFPDNWGHLAPYNPADAEFWEDVRKTHAEINGKKYKPVKDIKKWYDKLHNDGAEYKMWGNGIALPNAEYVIRGIAEQGAKTLGSLFDGSGGFPLAGAMNGIAPIWASEVEPYPIAVTKSRFKEVQNG